VNPGPGIADWETAGVLTRKGPSIHDDVIKLVVAAWELSRKTEFLGASAYRKNSTGAPKQNGADTWKDRSRAAGQRGNLTEWFGAKRYQRGQLMRSSYRIEGGSSPSYSTARRTKKQGATYHPWLTVPSALSAPKA